MECTQPLDRPGIHSLLDHMCYTAPLKGLDRSSSEKQDTEKFDGECNKEQYTTKEKRSFCRDPGHFGSEDLMMNADISGGK